MGPFEAILVLSLVGFLLLAAEVFVPGLVLGALGGICLIGAVGVAYANYGALTGSFVFAGLGVAVTVGFVAWMAIFPSTPIGRKILLKKNLQAGPAQEDKDPLTGKQGVALTPLRPAGTIQVDGRKIDVVAEADFIEAGAAVEVVLREGMRVVVRKKREETQPPAAHSA